MYVAEFFTSVEEYRDDVPTRSKKVDGALEAGAAFVEFTLEYSRKYPEVIMHYYKKEEEE